MADGLPACVPLPERAICLHIGVHKTGTTALQAALAATRPELRRHGVSYPGSRVAHHGAAMAVLERSWGWGDRGGQLMDAGVFDALTRQARRQRGRVIVSSEQFCEATDAQAARVVAGFGAERTHVVIGLRNLGRLLPSSWQQYLKYGQTMPYERWLQRMFDPKGPGRTTPTFWRRNDHAAVVRRWAELVGAEQVTVLVLEEVGPSAQFVAFAQLLGVPSGVLLDHATLQPNRSMTAAEAEFLRRLNVAVKGQLGWADYERIVREGIARQLVEGRQPASDEPRLATPGWALDAAAERGSLTVTALEETGVRVVGDRSLLALRLPDQPAPPARAADVLRTDDVVAVVAAQVLAAQTGDRVSGRARRVAGRARRAVVGRVPGLGKG